MGISERYLTEGGNIWAAGKEIRKSVNVGFDVDGCE